MMTYTAKTVDHNTLIHLLNAGLVHGVDVSWQSKGWSVIIKWGTLKRTLASQRGTARIFRKLETIVVYLKEIGVAKYQVDATGYDPVALKLARSNVGAGARMKAAHEALSHTDWLKDKLTSSAADTRPRVSHKLVMNEAQAIINQTNE